MLLEFQNITKSFGPKQVLKGISFQAESGRAFGLLGRNGAGKTTSIRILMNVFPADSGRVLLDGASITDAKVKIGYLPEERGLYPKKIILDQLIYFARLQGMDKASAAREVDRWLKRLGMAEYRNKRLDTLSKGNQQKIQLVTALAHDPQIVILDEPFSGLDPVNAQLLKDVVKEEIARGKIVLFSSHQMNYIEEFCDHIAILRDGQIALTGDLKEIKHSYPRNRLVIRSAQAAQLVQETGAVRLSPDEVMLTLNDPSEKAARMQALATRFDLDEIRVFEPSLNDIFVEYAGDQEEKRL